MTGSRPPKPKRRWYQFSLRSLLVFVLAAGLGLGLLGRRIRQVQEQRKPVIELQKLGATVEYQETEGGLSNALLRNLVGDEALPVVEIYFLRTEVTDAGLVHLKGMRSLEVVDLRCTQVSDAGLVHLKGMRSLEVVDLRSTQVSDAGLVHLKGLTSLEVLYVNNTKITDAGLEHLKGLSSLEGLSLLGTQVTDAGLEHLKGLSSLEWMNLCNTQVTEGGVQELQQALPNCVIGFWTTPDPWSFGD